MGATHEASLIAVPLEIVKRQQPLRYGHHMNEDKRLTFIALQSQDGFKLNMWDIGGQKAIRPYWKNYYDRTNGIVFVVDSSDEERLQEAVSEFKELMAEEALSTLPLLVFANKQDLDLAAGADEVLDALDLSGISDRQWQIQACSAMTAEGK